jgi:hypothetical protein
MQKKTGWIAAGVITLATIGGATGIAAATGGGGAGNDDGTAITGPAYDRATTVALDAAGGGKVTQTEQGDEESYYQVEVTKADGSQVDVNLDRSFKVVKTKAEAGETKDGAKDAPDGHEDGKPDGETKDDGPQG